MVFEEALKAAAGHIRHVKGRAAAATDAPDIAVKERGYGGECSAHDLAPVVVEAGTDHCAGEVMCIGDMDRLPVEHGAVAAAGDKQLVAQRIEHYVGAPMPMAPLIRIAMS